MHQTTGNIILSIPNSYLGTTPAAPPQTLPVTSVLWVRTVRTVPHVGLHIQQLQGRDPRLPSQVLQDLQPWPAVLVELSANIQQGLPRSSELLPGNSLIQLLSGQALPLLQQVKVFPGKLQKVNWGPGKVCVRQL